MPAKKEDLPSTLKRSPKKVQDTYAKTLDSAHEQYDSEERAHRTAFAAVKHVAERKGDHWSSRTRRDRRTSRPANAAGQRVRAAGRPAASTPTSQRKSSTTMLARRG